ARLSAASRELRNVADAIARVGLDEALMEKRASLLAEQDRLRALLDEARGGAGGGLLLPDASRIRGVDRGEIAGVAAADPRVGRLMRRLVPSLSVHPFRLCDGGAVVLRARLRLCLAPLAGRLSSRPEVREALTRRLTVDLFEPPQRVVFRRQAVA